MAQIIWSEPALLDLDNVAEYIALSNPVAAKALVKKIMEKIERLELFPQSGKIPNEISDLYYRELGYREIVVPPCRIFYREDTDIVYIVHVCREERDIRKFMASF